MYKRLEELFGRFGAFITRHPFVVILFSLAIVAFPISQLPKITMDTSTEGFLHKDDPMLLHYNAFKEQFGRDEHIVIAITSDKIFSIPFLTKLKQLHKELEDNLPYLDEVTSLVNVRNTRGEGDQLIVEDLLENFPKNEQEVAKLKKIAMGNEFYRNLLLSKDGKITTIIIETQAYTSDTKEDLNAMFDAFDDAAQEDVKKEPLTDEQNAQIVKKVKEIVAKYEAKDFDIHYAGSPSVMDALKTMMREDMQKFTRVTIAIILVFLFLIFRRISATFYPLIVIVLALLSTVGSMAYFGAAFKLPTQIVPSLLIAVSIGATVHVLSIFFDRFNATKEKAGSIIFTLQHSGLAIMMTGVTTAIGIASFAGSEVAPISDMGVFASLGVVTSLFLTLTLLPALLMVTRLKPKPVSDKHRLDNLMQKLAYLPTHHPKSVLFVSLALVLISLMLATNIRTSHYPLEWFPKDDPNYIGTHYIDANMNGSLTMEMVLDTKEENGWQNPKRLQKLDTLYHELEGYDDGKTYIGKIVSLNNIIKESNRALHENNQSYYSIPKDQALVSQELLLFENSGSDDLEDVVDSQFSKLRVTLKLPWVDSIDTEDILNHVKKRYHEVFSDLDVTMTGIIPILSHTFTMAIHSSVVSYFIAFMLIAICMMFIMGSIRLGLISMIPNLSPIIIGLTIMYIYHIPLDMFTLLIGSIAIGLAVDDTIHFMHNFRRYYHSSGDAIAAVESTFYTTGKAMVITSIVLSLGFYAYMFGQMQSVQNFGFLTGSVIVLALLADLMLAPALMVLVAKKGWIR
ncbi:MAG: MMPL family transporter [Epsilonproteobacteria bacterium]|nr:MMPL family transporter [Campylobacterota bacterium]